MDVLGNVGVRVAGELEAVGVVAGLAGQLEGLDDVVAGPAGELEAAGVVAGLTGELEGLDDVVAGPAAEVQAVGHLVVAGLVREVEGVDDVVAGLTGAREGLEDEDEDVVVGLAEAGGKSNGRGGESQRCEQEGHHDG